ncbi:MAG: AAA family ATPase [Chloroflexi bacterium]|nr:AAA family ATPase [Chloroflexota bacterium]
MSEVTDSYTLYMPMDRRQAIANATPLPDRTEGSVLFADISGFTPLTSTLAEELGPERGVELLTNQLNQVYGDLINQVHRYQGSIISFAGDAITCWFDQDNGLRATAAGTAMQKVMMRYSAVITPANTAVEFGIKVAITAGTTRRFTVGNPRINAMDVIAGRLLDRVAAAEQQIQQGEIIIGHEVVQQLGDTITVKEWREANGESFAIIANLNHDLEPIPWQSFPTIDHEISRDWILPPIYMRLAEGLGEFIAELRPAVTLFLKFSGIDYDQDDEAGNKLDAYIRWVQSVFAKYEAYLLQITIGDKGSYLYTLFGAPTAHEDDTARAVAAAIDLQAMPERLDFIQDVQIGISQGIIYAGTYGSKERHTYAGLGNQVNTAARLMSTAKPGQTLVSDTVAKTAVRYKFQTLGEMKLKGKKKPQPIYTVQAQETAQVDDSLKGRSLVPIVGRTTEQTVLQTSLDRLQVGVSSALVIEGEAGIGKSRLVADLQEKAAQLNVQSLIGLGDAIEQSTAYHAWRSVFRSWFGIKEGDGGTAVHDKVRTHFDQSPHLLERIPLLNAVLPLNLPDNDLTAQMNGDVRAGNTRDILTTILSQSTSPLLLILEDAHWFDSASWALMEQVQKAVLPLMLVIVTRPIQSVTGSQNQLPPEYRRVLENERTQHLQLNSLKPDDAIALVCRRLGVSALPEPVSDLILARAEGHPFFSEEMAYGLRDAGHIEIKNGRCQLTDPATRFRNLDFPDTIQGVITSRVDRLSPGQQLTLKVASVIGRVFPYQTLHHIHPVVQDKGNLPTYLNTLDKLEITPQETPPPEVSYIFKHITFQEVAYNLLLFSQRRQLHSGIAERIETENAQDLSSFYPLLAHHWTRAEVSEKAIAYLEKAGEQALRNGAYREVIDFIQQAITLTQKQPQVAHPTPSIRHAYWQQLLGEAHFGLGLLVESREHFLAALISLGWPMPISSGDVSKSLLRELLHYIWVVSIPDKIRLRIKPPTPDARTRRLAAARAYEPLGLVYYFANETLPAVYTALHRFILAKEAGMATSELARGYASVCGIFMLAQMYRRGQEYGRQARNITRAIKDQPALAWALLSTSVFSIGVAPWKNIEAWLREAIQLDKRLQDKRSLGDCISVLRNVYYFQGKFQESHVCAEELYKVGNDSGNLEHKAWGITGQANAKLQMGNTSAALSLYAESIASFPEIAEDDVHEAETNGLMAVAYLRQGNLDAAKAAADHVAAKMMDTLPAAYVLFSAFAGMTQVYLALWEAAIADGADTSELRPIAEKATKAMARFARLHPIGRPRRWLYTGWTHWLAGSPRRAQRAWRKALKLAQNMSMTYEEGLVHYEIGRHLKTTHPKRATHLRAAKSIFERLNAAHNLKMVAEIRRLRD